MTTKKKIAKPQGSAAGSIAAVSAGVIAVAAASYFFFGPEGKKNRNSLKGWMVKMKGEVIEKLEESKDMSQATYEKIVDTIAVKYAKAGKLSESEIRMFADLLKQQWQGIIKSHNKMASVKKAVVKVAKTAKKEVKKVAKAPANRAKAK